MRALLLLTSLLAVASACGGGAPPATKTAPQTPPAAPLADGDAPDGAAPAAPALPTTATDPSAEDTLRWFLTSLAAGPLSLAEVEARFSSTFLQQVPASQVVQIFTALQQQLPPVSVTKQEGKAPLELSAWLTTKAGGMRVDIVMSATTPRKIDGLLIKPVATAAPPRSYQEAVDRLAKTGEKHQVYVAKLDRGACSPVFRSGGEQRLAIASTSKLWVLLALDEKLRKDKTLTWDKKLPIRDESKSLPSGIMQDVAAGTEYTLREYATQMISISDNTATDHLIEFIGDAGLARALSLAKHGAPAMHLPYLRTRDLFGLKISATAEELAAYRKATVAAKRKLLAELRQRPIDLAAAVAAWTAPRALDLEWFASGPEVCRTLAALAARGELDPQSELLAALGKGQGVDLDRSQWRYVGFKGGSEPGVIYLAYLLQRTDGAWFVAIVGVNDATRNLDEGEIISAATGVLSVLGTPAAPAGPAAPAVPAGPAASKTP
ncbi:MAG: serine hydrolase [Myxococcales bacterium]|nr:serine hydrolase [Myxococcales bacterium]